MATPSGTRHRSLAGGELERVLREALGAIRFGTVTLVIQDGRVIQVEKSEKIRLKNPDFIDGSGI